MIRDETCSVGENFSDGTGHAAFQACSFGWHDDKTVEADCVCARFFAVSSITYAASLKSELSRALRCLERGVSVHWLQNVGSKSGTTTTAFFPMAVKSNRPTIINTLQSLSITDQTHGTNGQTPGAVMTVRFSRAGCLATHRNRPAWRRKSPPPYTTTRAIEFMEQAKNESWCLHLSYIKPHWPYIVPAPYHDMYDKNDIQRIKRDPCEKKIRTPCSPDNLATAIVTRSAAMTCAKLSSRPIWAWSRRSTIKSDGSSPISKIGLNAESGAQTPLAAISASVFLLL